MMAGRTSAPGAVSVCLFFGFDIVSAPVMYPVYDINVIHMITGRRILVGCGENGRVRSFARDRHTPATYDAPISVCKTETTLFYYTIMHNRVLINASGRKSRPNRGTETSNRWAPAIVSSLLREGPMAHRSSRRGGYILPFSCMA